MYLVSKESIGNCRSSSDFNEILMKIRKKKKKKKKKGSKFKKTEKKKMRRLTEIIKFDENS